jgi:hypothetical protein
MYPSQSDPPEFAEEPSSRLSLEARREVIMRIFGTADGHFVSSYVRCLVEYGLEHEDFIAGDVTALFEKRNGLLTIHEAKSLGGLFMQLQRKGVIEKTGMFRSRNQGSPAAVYRLKK